MTRKHFLSLAGALLAAPFGAQVLARESYGITLTGDDPVHPVLIRGGVVKSGSGVRDDVPALLCGGYIMNRDAIRRYGLPTLHRLNRHS